MSRKACGLLASIKVVLVVPSFFCEGGMALGEAVHPCPVRFSIGLLGKNDCVLSLEIPPSSKIKYVLGVRASQGWKACGGVLTMRLIVREIHELSF